MENNAKPFSVIQTNGAARWQRCRSGSPRRSSTKPVTQTAQTRRSCSPSWRTTRPGVRVLRVGQRGLAGLGHGRAQALYGKDACLLRVKGLREQHGLCQLDVRFSHVAARASVRRLENWGASALSSSFLRGQKSPAPATVAAANSSGLPRIRSP